MVTRRHATHMVTTAIQHGKPSLQSAGNKNCHSQRMNGWLASVLLYARSANYSFKRVKQNAMFLDEGTYSNPLKLRTR
jgi:hypothetical protein